MKLCITEGEEGVPGTCLKGPSFLLPLTFGSRYTWCFPSTKANGMLDVRWLVLG
jgi:hypothetical protein